MQYPKPLDSSVYKKDPIQELSEGMSTDVRFFRNRSTS